jgi:hypothetical protein
MTSATGLPTALVPWAPALAALDVELAVAIGPLVRQLDLLVTRNDPGTGAHGPLDGYAGLARRGAPDRMLISEWALAAEVPAEFLRRASVGELLYLEPTYQADQQRGRVAVLVDTGPDQLGAGRLVQLAALVVLYRRAAGRGAELVIGILGDEPGKWRSGELARLLPGWLRGRRAGQPDAEHVGQWADTLDEADELWLLTGPRLATTLPGRRRTMSSRECAWSEHGATAVEVLLDGVRVQLALPRQDLAVQALRGAAFRPDTPAVVDVAGEATLGPPTFPGVEARLLARGRDLAELVAAKVPMPGISGGRLRRHQFAGPVLAATTFHHRILALVLDGDRVRVRVIGKRLARLDGLTVPAQTFGGDVEALVADRPAPLYFAMSGLWCRLAGGWWRITPDGDVTPERVAAIGLWAQTDDLRVVRLGGKVRVGRAWVHVHEDARVVFGARGSLALSTPDDPQWTVWPSRVVIPVEDGVQVLGLVEDDRRTELLAVSREGVLVRLFGPSSRRTLTRWSGGTHPPALHPIQPWLAVRRDDGRIEVGDLTTNALLLTMRPGQ